MDKIDKVIKYFRSLREEGIISGNPSSPPTNSLAYGQIAGTSQAGDDPPIRKKKKRYVKGGKGSRKLWLDFLKTK